MFHTYVELPKGISLLKKMTSLAAAFYWHEMSTWWAELGSTFINCTHGGLVECRNLCQHGHDLQVDVSGPWDDLPWYPMAHDVPWHSGTARSWPRHGRCREAEFQESCLEKESTWTKGNLRGFSMIQLTSIGLAGSSTCRCSWAWHCYYVDPCQYDIIQHICLLCFNMFYYVSLNFISSFILNIMNLYSLPPATPRSKVWDALEENNAVLFPRPCHGRIPNCAGSAVACPSLRREDWDCCHCHGQWL